MEDLEGQEINRFRIEPLREEGVVKYAGELAELADQIPLVNYSEEVILAESKEGRVFHGKWDHSLVAFDGDKLAGLAIGYEREGEGNEQYPENTLYISELAVAKDYRSRGLGRKLLGEFLRYNQEKGLIYLDGELNFSVQTNSADWNKHVVELYESFGFKKRAMKEYDNRIDVVLGFKT